MTNFFEILKQMRLEKNFKQQYIADFLEISVTQYQNYEKKTLPPHDKLLKLNELFNYDFSKLIYSQEVVSEHHNFELVHSYDELTAYREKYLDYKEKYLRCQEELLTLKNEGGPGFRRKAN